MATTVNREVTEIVIDARPVKLSAEMFAQSMDQMSAADTAFQSRHEQAIAKFQSSERQRAAILDRVPLSYDRVSAAMYKLEASTDRVSAASYKAANEFTRNMALIDRSVTLGVRTASEAAVLEAQIRRKQVEDIDRVRLAQDRLNDTHLHGRVAGNDNMVASRRQNLGFQAQDIGVSLYGGMPVGTVLAQQGSQIAGAYMGAGGGIKALGADLRAMTVGAAEATVATLGLTGTIATGFGIAAAAAGAYYLLSRESSADVAERLAREDQMISGVAKQWGDATPALKAYNDELERKASLEGLQNASNTAAARQYDDLRVIYPNTQVDLADARSLVPQDDEYADRLRQMTTDYNVLTARIGDSTAEGRDALAVSRDLFGLFDATGIPALKTYAETYRDLAPAIDRAAESARRFHDDATGQKIQDMMRLTPMNPLDGFNRSPFQSEPDILADRQRRDREAEENRRLGALVPIPTARPNREDMLAEADKAATKQTSAYDRLVDMAESRIRQLHTEAAAMGLAGSALERYRFEQGMINDAAQQNIDLTAQQIAGIHKLGERYEPITDAPDAPALAADLSFDERSAA